MDHTIWFICFYFHCDSSVPKWWKNSKAETNCSTGSRTIVIIFAFWKVLSISDEYRTWLVRISGLTSSLKGTWSMLRLKNVLPRIWRPYFSGTAIIKSFAMHCWEVKSNSGSQQFTTRSKIWPWLVSWCYFLGKSNRKFCLVCRICVCLTILVGLKRYSEIL